MVMIGIDPHKATHTAVAIDGDEVELGARAGAGDDAAGAAAAGVGGARSTERTWAIESAGGLGYLLAQQLVAAGETRRGRPATLASRVRVLGTGRSDKNDPNDARSVAIAALRAPTLRPVRVEDHATVLRLLAKRNTRHRLAPQPGRAVGCMRWWRSSRRAGSPRNSLLLHADRLLDGVDAGRRRSSRSATTWRSSCSTTSRRLDAQLQGVAQARSATPSPRRGRRSPTSSGSARSSPRSLIGHTGDVAPVRQPRTASPPTTAPHPIELSSGGPSTVHRLSRRGNRTLNHAHPHRRDHPDPPRAQSRPRLLRPQASPKARPRKKRSAR